MNDANYGRQFDPMNQRLKYACLACAEPLPALRDFGPQPMTNRFRAEAAERVPVHPLILGQCPRCALVQLLNPAAPALVKPPSLMKFNEPEGHLDALADRIADLPGVSQTSRICGVTYKEATTLERLRARGYHNATLLSAETDLQILDDCAGLETIQARFTPDLAAELVARHGAFDVVFVRHLLEHAHDLRQLIGAIKGLAAPGGYIVFEVPDCTTMFAVLDYSFLWEEHVAYFTPDTLTRTLRLHGLPPELVITYPYALENSLVAVARRVDDAGEPPIASDEVSSNERERVERYVAQFPSVRGIWQDTLKKLRSDGPIALLGAGHLAVTWINLLGVEPLIDCVCDDAADKVHRYLPGTQLRISPSSVLLQQAVRVCLMAVAPESEPKVLARNQEFIARGGRFASIFAASDHALKLAAADKQEWDES
jgi:SAM-dependent methyltransferase